MLTRVARNIGWCVHRRLPWTQGTFVLHDALRHTQSPKLTIAVLYDIRTLYAGTIRIRP